MKILFASDHAGFELKAELIKFLVAEKYEVEDCGPLSLDTNDDYPKFIIPCARKISENPNGLRAVIIGGSGEGEAIAANRLKGVRAATYYGGNADIVILSRKHNDSNVLSLGARFMTADEAKEALKLWLKTPFSGEERHIRRIQEIDQLS